MSSSLASSAFGSAFKQWRRHRKLSQLELALAADVSQRHVSWLETGRSQPSRDMVLRLAAAMELPLRDRNALLHVAGYAPVYRESALTDDAMAPVHDALKHVLDHHNPLPAIVIDRLWNLVMTNDSALRLFSQVGDLAAMNAELGGGERINFALLTLHPEGLRNIIANWGDVGPALVQRMSSEAMSTGDPELRAQFEKWIALAGDVDAFGSPFPPLLPVLPLELALGDVRLSLFSTLSTFGTPQDITTDELRVEAFYPADAATAAFFRNT
ncbi:MAG: helix-turn-helix transcriptional regulator [Pseudomonadota bacterium]